MRFAGLTDAEIDTLEPLGAEERGAVYDVANPPERIARMVLAQLDRD